MNCCTVSLLTVMVNFIAAGADLMIAVNILKESDGLIVDHPTEAGYAAFYKQVDFPLIGLI